MMVHQQNSFVNHSIKPRVHINVENVVAESSQEKNTNPGQQSGMEIFAPANNVNYVQEYLAT